jgi:hypothetical protein
MKKAIIAGLLLSLISTSVYAAKAAVLITNIRSNGTTGFMIDYFISTDTGLEVGSGGSEINLVSSTPSIVSAIKVLARQVLNDVYQVDVVPADMTVFGGPQ